MKPGSSRFGGGGGGGGFRLNYSVYRHTSIGCNAVLIVATVFNLAKVQFFACVQPLSLSFEQRVDQWRV